MDHLMAYFVFSIDFTLRSFAAHVEEKCQNQLFVGKSFKFHFCLLHNAGSQRIRHSAALNYAVLE